MTMLVRQCSRAVARSVRVAASSQPRVCVAAVAKFQQRAGFATMYDNKPMPFEDVNRHRSDAEMRIAEVPVIEVEGDAAVCDGGGGALGHPLEFIQLDTVQHNSTQTCKYCGLRYKKKEGFHGHHH